MSQRLFSLIYLTLLSFFISPCFALETFIIDPNHTYVQWHINHFGYSNPSGKWMAQGQLLLDDKNPENSKVNVSIDVTHFITGINKLDEHLSGEEFFDVAKYPSATFVSTKVKLTGKNTAEVYGNLTLRGITKPVMLKANLNKVGESMLTHKMTVGFTANSMLKRSDFGMKAYLPGLSDEVKLDIEVEAFIPKDIQHASA